MSKLFRSRSSKASAAGAPHYRNEPHHHQHPDDLTSQYSSLLDPVLTIHHEQPVHSTGPFGSSGHRRAKSSPSGSGWSHGFSSTTPDLSLSSRPWLAAAESRPSWDRPPARKLVKEPNGSGRPSFSIELSDSEGEGSGKGLLRRQLRRLKELYHRGEK